MDAGVDLDRAVAEKVMRLTPGADFGEWAKHDWKRREDGEVDTSAWESDNHSGPMCSRCYYSYCDMCRSEPSEPCKVAPPPFSRDDAAAMRVVDEMVRRGWNATLKAFDGVWEAEFWGAGPFQVARHVDRRVAICLASLAAVESVGTPPHAEGTG